MGYIEVIMFGRKVSNAERVNEVIDLLSDDATLVTVGVSAERLDEVLAVLKQFNMLVIERSAGMFSVFKQYPRVNDDARNLHDILLDKYYLVEWRARVEWLGDADAYRLWLD